MTKLLASFEFNNAEFDITEQTKGNVYLKICRELVCSAYLMPAGGNGGLVTKITVLNRGVAGQDLVWELSDKHNIIDSGYTNDGILPLPLPSDNDSIFSIKLYMPSRTALRNNNHQIHPTTFSKIVILQIRNEILTKLPVIILDRLSDATVQFGSAHMDNSEYNRYYKRSIRIEIPNRALHHVYFEYDQLYYMHILTYFGPKRTVAKKMIRLEGPNLKITKILNILSYHLLQPDTYVNTLRSSPVASL